MGLTQKYGKLMYSKLKHFKIISCWGINAPAGVGMVCGGYTLLSARRAPKPTGTVYG